MKIRRPGGARRTVTVVAVLLLCVAGAGSGRAADPPEIVVDGLFKDRAIVRIDGRRRLLRVGETSPEGVTLISADSEEAVVEHAGKRIPLGLGTRIGSHYEPPREQRHRIVADGRGMYFTTGSINGYPTRFVVDTGATFVSMNAGEARRLGIDFRVVGRPAASSTAAGISRVWLVELDRVKIGEIEVRNVGAAVHEGDFPQVTLLGNSFLSRVEMTRAGGALLIERRY